MKKGLFLAGCIFAGVSLPAATLTVDRNGGSGMYRTIGEAAAKAVPGDVIQVRPGVYREHVAPERGGEPGRPVTYRAAERGTVFLRGSEEWKPVLTPVPGEKNLFTTPVPEDAFFGDFPNPFRRKLNAGGRDKKEPARPASGALLPYSLGQIFCDGGEYVIPFRCVRKIGPDIILVEIHEEPR